MRSRDSRRGGLTPRVTLIDTWRYEVGQPAVSPTDARQSEGVVSRADGRPRREPFQ